MNFLILSVTAGEGHNSTAKALKTKLEELSCNCQILDMYKYVSPELAKIISEGYLLVTEKAKKAYRIGYRFAENRKNAEHGINGVKLMNVVVSNDCAKFINSERFDAIVFTHPFAGVMLDVMKERHIINNKTLGILTDFTFHPYWEDCTLNDFIVTPNSLLLPQALKKGFRAEQILPLGIPINPKFAVSLPKTDARLQLGLNPNLPTLLVMGGSMGYGHIADIIIKLDALDIDRDFQIVAVCGNNAEAKKQADKIAQTARHKMIVFGFTDRVSTIMDASDCIITKPGGLTTSESLSKILPMIITDPIPGHEERNTEFLLNTGCAMYSTKTCPIDECVYQLLSSNVRVESMKKCISTISKPHSTADVCNFLINMCHIPSINEYDELRAPDFDNNPIYLDENGKVIR